MKRTRFVCALTAFGLAVGGFRAVRASDDIAVQAPHSECTYFQPEYREAVATEARLRSGRLTVEVTKHLPPVHVTGSQSSSDPGNSGNLIDGFIFPALVKANVTPAVKTSDYEFIRRVTLDLTGRIPTPDQVATFVADTSSLKRMRLVDDLLNRPEWVDKWTMYYGDRLKNTSNKTAVRMYDDGRNAFYLWIRNSLAGKKPYDQFVREIIAAKGTNTYDPAQGALNWVVGGRVVNGPQQDIWDQQVANVSETFLGLANVNCLLCHNGRGHLDTINLWASQVSRYQAWQLSSFFSHSNETLTRTDPTMNNSPYYWGINDDAQYKTDYALNTTTGNRPTRAPVGTTNRVAPNYFLTGSAPNAGENYRDALARLVTSDFQFARATVNYIWAEFFGRGIVSPTNQFDLARLDPKNPPPDGWTLQPSNPELLDALAKDFVQHGYDIRRLMKVITTSEAYQLSSRYDPAAWNPSWEPLFARHLVRRLWGEEVMDALAQSSGIFPTYTVNTLPTFKYAMQSPEPLAILGNNNILKAFMPGNRDDQERKTDGATQQGLAMMNDNLVMARTRVTAAGGLLSKLISMTPADMVDQLYLNALSRYPTADEKKAALAGLANTGQTRQQNAEDLLWSLYNKVDFLFNY